MYVEQKLYITYMHLLNHSDITENNIYSFKKTQMLSVLTEYIMLFIVK